MIVRDVFFIFRKLRSVLTTRIVRYLQEQARKDPEEYLKFYADYGTFFKEGIVSSADETGKVNTKSCCEIVENKTN